MKRKSLMMLAVTSVMLVFVLSAFTILQDGKKESEKWEIPAKYKEMKNTFAGDESLVKIGKMHYMKHCRSCHGNTGLGDGPKAKSLDTFPGYFNAEAFQAQTDGEIYYQSIIGRGDMPNYESKIPEEEDRWALIMYVRSLK